MTPALISGLYCSINGGVKRARSPRRIGPGPVSGGRGNVHGGKLADCRWGRGDSAGTGNSPQRWRQSAGERRVFGPISVTFLQKRGPGQDLSVRAKRAPISRQHRHRKSIKKRVGWDGVFPRRSPGNISHHAGRHMSGSSARGVALHPVDSRQKSLCAMWVMRPGRRNSATHLEGLFCLSAPKNDPV